MHIPPGAEWFDLCEYYVFRVFLLTGFVIWLYRRIKIEFKEQDRAIAFILMDERRATELSQSPHKYQLDLRTGALTGTLLRSTRNDNVETYKKSSVSWYAPVLGWSIHMTGGWQKHLIRIERWHKRLVAAQTADDGEDFLYAFFEYSFAFRDWLVDIGTVSQQQMEILFSRHVELRINRDIANSLNHHSIIHPSQE